MRAIYEGKVYYVSDDSEHGIILAGEAGPVTVPYSDPTLIVDPTDDEIESAGEAV